MAGERGGYRGGDFRKADPAREEYEALQERFQEVVGEKLPRLFQFKASDLSFSPESLESFGIDQMAVTFVGKEKDKAVAEAGHVLLHKPRARKQPQFTLTKEGQLFGEIPREFPMEVTKRKVLREIIEHVERLKIDRWNMVKLGTFAAPHEEGTARGPGGGDHELPRIDPERLEFYAKQPGVRLRILSEKSGAMKGPIIMVYPNFLVYDSQYVDNAAYVIDNVPPEQLQPPKGILTDAEVEAWMLQQPWGQLVQLDTKKWLQDLGAKSTIHKGDWQSRLQTKLDERVEK